MKIWKNTNILDKLLDPSFQFTDEPIDADIALLGSKSIDTLFFTNLKGIFRVSATPNEALEFAAEADNIAIESISEVVQSCMHDEVSSFAAYLILSSLYDNVGSVENWTKYPRKHLRDNKLLIVGGEGNIGYMLGEKMQDFMTVHSYDTSYSYAAPSAVLNSRLSTADIVTLHIPADGNTNFINAEKLSWMKDGATLINTARAPIVSESALWAELNSGRLKAVFDVMWEEPYNGRYLTLPKDVFRLTPHVASTNSKFTEQAYVEFKDFMRGLYE
jgi:phosphoglycerate dehydrogenase-like enzyme